MRVLIIHNQYASPGGEDAVVKAEQKLLTERGHEIAEYTKINQIVHGVRLLPLSLTMIWSTSSAKSLSALIRSFKPNIVHIHNTFIRISPSVYSVCKQYNLPVVQTFHNFRLLCPSALLFRDGHVCDECIGKLLPISGIIHGCWRNSPLGTASVGIMLLVHKILKTWHKKVDLYIALTEFSKKKLVQGGFNSNRIYVMPNFVEEDHIHLVNKSTFNKMGMYAIYVGRLSPEKGVDVLVEAWNHVPHVPLKIIGAGPFAARLVDTLSQRNNPAIEYLGSKSRCHVLELIAYANFLVLPSCCYENFPVVIGEAFSLGIPVIASRLGAMAEIVEDGKTGLLFTPGDAEDLAAKVEWAWNHPAEMAEMGKAARREYEEKYTAERNYQMLMEIYQKAIENHQRHQ